MNVRYASFQIVWNAILTLINRKFVINVTQALTDFSIVQTNSFYVSFNVLLLILFKEGTASPVIPKEKPPLALLLNKRSSVTLPASKALFLTSIESLLKGLNSIDADKDVQLLEHITLEALVSLALLFAEVVSSLLNSVPRVTGTLSSTLVFIHACLMLLIQQAPVLLETYL